MLAMKRQQNDLENRMEIMDMGSDTEVGNAEEKVIIGITGMHCASCVSTIEKSLKKVEGVSSVVVNLASEKAYVDFDPERTTTEDLKTAIGKSGYEASGIEIEGETPSPPQVSGEQDIALNIGGMTCAACAQNVEKALKKTKGISKANVNLATEKANITFDPGVIDLDEIGVVVDSAGYKVLGTEDVDREEQKMDDARKRMI